MKNTNFHNFELKNNSSGHTAVYMDGKLLKGIAEVQASAKAEDKFGYITIKFITSIYNRDYIEKIVEPQTTLEQEE